MLIASTRYTESDYVEIVNDILAHEILTNNFLNVLIDRSLASSIGLYTIPIEQRYRKDLVSNTVYGRSDLYWVLELFSGLIYLEEWAEGRQLLVPSLLNIEYSMQYVKELGK